MDFGSNVSENNVSSKPKKNTSNQICSLERIAIGSIVNTLAYPIEIAKVKAQVDPSYYLRLRYKELFSSNRFMGAFTPHLARVVVYCCGVEFMRKNMRENFKIDIEQQGMFRRMLNSFVPVAFGLYISNIFDVIRIQRISCIDKAEPVKTSLYQDLVKTLTNRRALMGVNINQGVYAGLCLLEEFYLTAVKQSYYMYNPGATISPHIESELRIFAFCYGMYWLYPIEKIRTVYISRSNLVDTPTAYNKKFYVEEGKEIWKIQKAQGMKAQLRGCIGWGLNQLLMRYAMKVLDIRALLHHN